MEWESMVWFTQSDSTSVDGNLELVQVFASAKTYALLCSNPSRSAQVLSFIDYLLTNTSHAVAGVSLRQENHHSLTIANRPTHTRAHV